MRFSKTARWRQAGWFLVSQMMCGEVEGNERERKRGGRGYEGRGSRDEKREQERKARWGNYVCDCSKLEGS